MDINNIYGCGQEWTHTAESGGNVTHTTREQVVMVRNPLGVGSSIKKVVTADNFFKKNLLIYLRSPLCSLTYLPPTAPSHWLHITNNSLSSLKATALDRQRESRAVLMRVSLLVKGKAADNSKTGLC